MAHVPPPALTMQHDEARDARLASPRRRAPWRRLPKGLRYLGVGAICAVTYNIALVGIVKAGVGYTAATIYLIPPMILLGYALNAAVTFETRFEVAALARYGMTVLASYPVWLALLYLLCDVAQLPIVVAAPVGTALMFVLNYVSAHWAILRSVRAAIGGERRSGRSAHEEPEAG